MRNQSSDKYSLSVQRPHLVLLGAGASKAAFPMGEKNGLIPPLMDDFFDIVEGLSEYLEKYGIEYKRKNFEDVYSSIEDSKYDEIRTDIEEIVYNYFVRMELPDEPTLYDHLVLSLTGRDVIATFNWDPFLFQALCRNCERVGKENLPWPFYLHGNTAIGVCARHEKIQIGHNGRMCSQCGIPLGRSKLLYPISKKDYNFDPYIKSSWNGVKSCLESAYLFTIFGYSAPSSDVEAVTLLQEGWGDKYKRSLEQIEIIDVLDENVLSKKWSNFIHTHHYDVSKSFYDSWISMHSRRSCDVCWDEKMECNPSKEYPIPKTASWKELDEWFKPLLEEEEKARSKRQN